MEWCDQVTVLGFNCRRDDLNLIKESQSRWLTRPARSKWGKRRALFIKTNGFRFVDIINYLGLGTSYEKWVKAYECSVQKSWLRNECFDSPEKLNYPGLPDYPAWYSRLKGAYVLSLSEFQECKAFNEKMRSFNERCGQPPRNEHALPLARNDRARG